MNETVKITAGNQPAPQHADPVAAFKRAQALENVNQFHEAEQIYRELLLAYPGHSAVLHNLSLVVRRRGNLDESLSLMQRAISSTPQEAYFRNSYGGMLRAAGRRDEAESAYRKAMELKPDYVDAQYNLALLLEERGDSEGAVAAHRAALAVQPDFAPAMVRIAALLNATESYEDALKLVDTATAIAPDLFDAHYYRGWILSNLKCYDDALEALARAATLRPDNTEVLLATANALRDAGRNEQALAAFWKLLEKRPERVETHSDLNQLAWTSGRHDLFLRSFNLARERIGDHANLLQLEAAFRVRREDYAAAETLLRKADKLAPERGDILGLLARSVAGQGRFEESYPLFFAAIGAEPNTMLHRQEFAFALLQAQRPAEALRIIEQARKAAPFDQLLLAGLTTAYRELGDSRYQALVDVKKYVRYYDIQAPEGYIDSAAFNAALAEELDALHTSRLEPIDQTLRGGTQTTGRLFAEPTANVQRLRSLINDAVSHYVGALPDDPDHPMVQRRTEAFGYSGSWSCRLGTGGHHGNHVHPQGWISSAYYARLPDIVDGEESREGWLALGQSNLQLGERDQPECFIKPVVGRLVLFPSFYWHGTVPFSGGGDRLTVAFDVLPL